jgi:hypothetical protein
VRLHARLRRLEQSIVADHGCPACQDRRGRAVLVEVHKDADGTVVSQEREPEPCARCGAVPERVIQVILTEAQHFSPACDAASSRLQSGDSPIPGQGDWP